MKKYLFAIFVLLFLCTPLYAVSKVTITTDGDEDSCMNETAKSVNTSLVDASGDSAMDGTANALKVLIVNPAGNEIYENNEVLPTIDIGHYEVHEGDHYFYTDSATLASGASMSYLISTTGTTDVHMTVVATGSAITQFDIYESTDLSGTGAKQVCQNNYRDSTNQATISIWDTVKTETTDGTLIYTMKSGSATVQSRSPSTEQRGHEIILKRKTKYLFRTTSGTADNLTNLQLQWYELS